MADRDGEVRDLLLRAKRGDREAWGRLYELHEDVLRRRTRGRLGSGSRAAHDDSTDVLQSVWGEVLRCLDNFEYRGQESFLAWATGILRHKLSRRATVAVRRGGVLTGSQADGLIAAERDSTTGPATEVGDREQEHLARRALESLDEPAREVLELSLLGDLTYREIGTRLGIGEDAVRTRVIRAEAKLTWAFHRLKGG